MEKIEKRFDYGVKMFGVGNNHTSPLEYDYKKNA